MASDASHHAIARDRTLLDADLMFTAGAGGRWRPLAGAAGLVALALLLQERPLLVASLVLVVAT